MNCSKTQNKHPHSAVSGENPSASAWMGPPGDLNLQSVCWHAYSTCSYAWLRHIRLWNSTSSAGPLTICHFLKYFPLRLFFTTSSRMGEDAAHNSLSLLCLWPFFFFFFNTFWTECHAITALLPEKIQQWREYLEELTSSGCGISLSWRAPLLNFSWFLFCSLILQCSSHNFDLLWLKPKHRPG